jgi:multimeric flavodoxin WrbA
VSLLIVYHSQSGGTTALARAAYVGAQSAADTLPIHLLAAPAVDAAAVRAARGLIIASPENFGYMAGLMKDFFDRCFYPCETFMAGKPYATLVCAGNDGTGATHAIDRIITGWRMKKAHPGVIARRIGGAAGSARGELDPADIASAGEVGALIAAGLEAGIF